jgi:hypothetical protein
VTGNADEPRPRFDTATGRRILRYDPHTGQPILEPEPDRWTWDTFKAWWDKQTNWVKALTAGGAAVAALVVVSIAFTAGGSSSGSGLSGVVRGQMVGAGNIGAGNALAWSHVYCGWKGDHVEVHADLTDGLPSDPVQKVVEDVTISPIYTIRWSDGSEHRHGDGIGSILDVKVPAGKTVSWWGNAGQPEGIKRGAPIGSCVPEVMDVTH